MAAIEIFRGRDIERLRTAGTAAAAVLAAVEPLVSPGATTGDIDRWVRQETRLRGVRSSVLGYRGYPAAVCTSRNDVVCHGIPSDHERLEPGDIINIDVTTELNGFHGDTSRTLFIGQPSPEARHVVDVAERCLWAGIAAVRDGAPLSDIGGAVEGLATREGCSVVKEVGGHGIGRAMHCPPHIPHTRSPGRGITFRTGMAFTIEPMVNLGAPDIVTLDDGWTIATRDGSLSAQFEHTILVTPNGCQVLTAADRFTAE